MKPFYQLSYDEVFKNLKSQTTGLSKEEAKEKFEPLYGIEFYGNCITEVKFNKFGVAILGDY